MDENIYSLFAARFAAGPNAPCLVLPDGARYSYDDLERAGAPYANHLTALGLRPGDRVAAQVEKSAQALFLYLGCVRAGCVFLPLNPAYQRAEVAFFLGDAKPGVFVHRPQSAALAAELAHAAGVAHAVALGDDGAGPLVQTVAAMVVREPGPSTITEQEIVAALKSRLAGFKVSKSVRFVAELPRNAMGKVQKNLLRQAAGA